MKKLLATTAITMIALSSAAMATDAVTPQTTVTGQSVLERVLNSINTTNAAPVNGTFANIAENLPVVAATTMYTAGAEAPITQQQYTAGLNSAVALVGAITPVYSSTTGELTGYTVGTSSEPTLAAAQAASQTLKDAAASLYASQYTASQTGAPAILNAIDGSVTNTMAGIDGTTANVNGTVTALQAPTVAIGNIATTALGAVNTGTTSLGVNASVAEALAGTSTAVNNTVTQIGGSANTGALVLNVASNATEVTGAVNNTMAGLNGTIGTISTTALGAVNTGTITNGVNAAANGVVAGIVGTNP